MSFLGSIVSKILHPFGGASEAQAQPSETQAQPSPTNPAATPTAGDTPASPSNSNHADVAAAQASTAGEPGSIDIEANLAKLAGENPQKLNWKTSIVDLLKLIDLDSSLSARQKLADELHYTGDKNDSATMNVWLHKQVIKKLEENGGKVPADLKD